jgi:hypothetical protein
MIVISEIPSSIGLLINIKSLMNRSLSNENKRTIASNQNLLVFHAN